MKKYRVIILMFVVASVAIGINLILKQDDKKDGKATSIVNKERNTEINIEQFKYNPMSHQSSDDYGQTINFNNGVYLFINDRINFGVELANFIDKHPNLKISAITNNGVSNFGNEGYFVIFIEK